MSEEKQGGEFVDHVIASSKVALFAKPGCPFCQKVRDVLAEFSLKEDALALVELTERPDAEEMQDHLKAITGGRTVPRLFVGGKFLGDSAEVVAMHEAGGIQQLLQMADALQ